MNTLKRIGKILFVTSLYAATPVLAAPAPECGGHMPLARLIADPDAYHGKALWLVAYVTIDFENMTACPSGKETQGKNCLWLDIDDGPYKTGQDYARYESRLKIWKQFDLQTVAMQTTFDKNSKGHLSMWPGGLKNVTQVLAHDGGWNFATNAAVPRSTCVDKFQLPKPPDGQRAMISGNQKLRNRDIDGAIADFDRAISLEPLNSGYYLIRARAKEGKHDYTGAVADYTRAIELAREDKDVLYMTRAEAREQAGDLDAAITDYTKAIEISPEFAGAYHNRGLAKRKKGDAQGAALDMARARQLATEPALSPPREQQP